MQTIKANHKMPRKGFAAAILLSLACGTGHGFAAGQSGGSTQFLDAVQYPEGRTEVRLEIAFDDAKAQTEEALAEIFETRQSARGLIVNLPDILFKSDRATLEPNAVEVLSRVAGILQVVSDLHIQIEGHTDNVGVSEYNSYLSNERANVVKDYLVGSGIPASRVSAAGFGETQPVAPNNTREGRERNRRVELVIVDSTADGRNQAALAAAAQ